MSDTVPEASAENADRARRPREGGQGLRSVARDQGPVVGAARGARLPQLRRQALLHPVRIDDAGAAHRRPPGGQQISLRLLVGVSPSFHVVSADRRAAVRQASQARRHRHRHAARHPHRLHQARHRPSRRHGANDRRPADHQRPAGEARRPKPPRHGPGRRQFAVRIAARPRALRFPRRGRRRQDVLPGAGRPRNPAQRPHL